MPGKNTKEKNLKEKIGTEKQVKLDEIDFADLAIKQDKITPEDTAIIDHAGPEHPATLDIDTPEEKPQQIEMQPGALSTTFVMCNEMILSRLFPATPLSSVEREGLRKSCLEIESYYGSSLGSESIMWVNFASCIGIIYGSRWMLKKPKSDDSRSNGEEGERKDNKEFSGY